MQYTQQYIVHTTVYTTEYALEYTAHTTVYIPCSACLLGAHFIMQSCGVANLFLLPPQPEYINC